MNHHIRLGVFCIAILSAIALGCAPQTNDLPTLTMEMADLLKTVNDETTAKAASAKLEALVKQIRTIQTEVTQGKARMPADIEEFGRRQEKAMNAYTKQVSRISEIPAAAKQLQGVIQELKP